MSKDSVIMYLKQTKNKNGRIYLSITDGYYDKLKKTSRSKTIESLGYLDELEKQYENPIAHFSKRVEHLNQEKKEKQAPINFTFYDSDRLCTGDDFRKNFDNLIPFAIKIYFSSLYFRNK